jgi:hypothetical protein
MIRFFFLSEEIIQQTAGQPFSCGSSIVGGINESLYGFCFIFSDGVDDAAGFCIYR